MYKVTQSEIRKAIQALQAAVGEFRGQMLHPMRSSRAPVVLMYHSVSERAQRDWGPWQYAVTPELFDQQLSYINKKNTVISLDELISWLAGNKSIPRDSVVLTFDDAFRDFRCTALPILENYDFPATVYVPTDLLLKSSAPYEYQLGVALSEQNEIQIKIDELSIKMDLITQDEIVSAYNRIKNKLKYSSMDRRKSALEKIVKKTTSQDKVLDPDEIKELHREPLVTIGAHGHEHIPLRNASINKQRDDIKICRKHLTDLLGTPPRHFSFPYGSFDQSAIRAVKEAGFESAVTTQSRSVSARDWGRPYTVPRIDAANGSILNRIK